MEKIGKIAFKAYMVYSICADMALLAGIIWLILKWEWFSFAASARARQ